MAKFVGFCRSLQRSLQKCEPSKRVEVFAGARREILDPDSPAPKWDDLVSRFCRSVMIDMAAQGWQLKARGQVRLFAPTLDQMQPEQAKEQIRQWHSLERDAQLREKSVLEFVRKAEQRRLYGGSWHSVFCLMRDGNELATKLSEIARRSKEEDPENALPSIISPYLQFVEPDAICQFTGLRLADIWRYFRHTWVNAYKSLPGRCMMVLIRDSAAVNHPVIGIAALGSSMAQQTQRDRWIGWDSDIFLESLMNKPIRKIFRWLFDSLHRLIKAIYLKDLFDDGTITARDIRNPTEESISRLLKQSKKAIEQHRRFPHAANHKSNSSKPSGKASWRKQAITHLFKSKRTKTLATLLSIRLSFQKHGLVQRSKIARKNIKHVLTQREIQRGIRQVVRFVKAEHVGVNMMDIVVCGAIAPYNLLLGGKLVCSLLCSPEVVEYYEKKYKKHESVIASSVKGRAVVRNPKLVLLATTSLYGVGSSQYNRIKLPLEQIGGRAGEFLEYIDLGVSKGFGSYHFSQLTLSLLEAMLARSRDGKKVNSIFGEGVNPLMRKIRDGLAIAGLPTDELLKHGNVRRVYGIPLARNFREILLGIAERPQYLIPRKDARIQTEQLAAFWRRRWLLARVTKPEILDQLRKHTVAFPVTHGARVPMAASNQGELFENDRRDTVPSYFQGLSHPQL